MISLLVEQTNGLPNPTYGPPASRAAFQGSIAALARLVTAGQATWTSTSTPESSFALVIHDYAPGNRSVVRYLLRRWELPESLARGDHDVVLQLELAFGPVTKPELNLQTRSVYDLIRIIASSVEIPPERAARGLPDPTLDNL